jgi:hypothetical protein
LWKKGDQTLRKDGISWWKGKTNLIFISQIEDQVRWIRVTIYLKG